MKIYYEPRKIAIKLSRRLLGLLPGLPPETGTLRRAEFGVCCVRYPYCFPLGHTVEGGDEPEVTPAKECELQFGGAKITSDCVVDGISTTFHCCRFYIAALHSPYYGTNH